MINAYKNSKFFHAFSVGIAAIIIFLVFIIVCNITPFGDSTWLVYDMNRQYADFYSYYKTILAGDNNILYSPAITLGSGAVGFFTYYLSSPFLLLLAFVKEANIPTVITLMIGLKLSVSAGCMDLFLHSYLDNDKSKTFLFALTYPFCAYIISNCVNPMWLDVYMMMPFVLWMLDRLIAKKAQLGYILSLAYIVWCNYYIAYMVCLFIIMWTIYRLVTNPENAFQKLFRVCICSLLAVALDAVLLLPTVFELNGSPKDVSELSYVATKAQLGLQELLSKLWVLAYDSAMAMFGTPLIYAGMIIVLLSILYFFNKKISIKEKVCIGVMMIIFVISFLSDPVNLIWHGGMEPSGYPYREAFLLVFLCIICSCKCFNLYAEGIEIKHIFISAVIVCLILIYSFLGKYQYVNARMVVINSLLFILILSSLFAYKYAVGKENKIHQLLILVLTMIQIGELLLNSIFIFLNQTNITMTGANEFKNAITTNQELVEYTRDDKGFYRMENMLPRQHNDCMMYNFNGVTHYSSSGSIYPRFFLQKLGYNDDGLYTHFGHDNTITADSILGIKYLLNASEWRTDYEQLKDAQVFKNPYAMSLAWTVNKLPQTADLNPFAYQEKIYSDVLNDEVRIFDNIIEQYQQLDDADVKWNRYVCKTHQDGYVYMYIDNIEDRFQNLEIYVDGEYVSGYGNLGCLKVLNLGYYAEGESFDIDVMCDDMQANLGEAYIVTEDTDQLAYYYDQIKDNNVDFERKSSSKYVIDTSALSTSDDVSGIVTTLSYSNNWIIKIDNTIVEPQMVYDTFLYIPFNQGDIIELSYVPKGIILGGAISSIALIIVILIIIFDKKKKESSPCTE